MNEQTANNMVHQSVMVSRVIEGLGKNAPLNNQVFIIDATAGTGGHLLEFVKKGYRVLGIDWDKSMLAAAEKRLKEVFPQGSFKLVQGNFKDIEKIARENGFKDVDAILFDLGVSNLQLTSMERGFSFANPDAPLDMRINPQEQGVTAADLINGLREDQLKDLFSRVLTRLEAFKLSRLVMAKRSIKKIETVGELVSVIGGSRPKPGLHPATLPFLALRIAVNSEIENLKEALPQALALLKKGGRILLISFHSGEDRIVKDFFAKEEKNKTGRIISDKPLLPSPEEVSVNPRARSARLRILEKTA